MSAIPQNVYAVQATLSVATTVEATANTTAATALTDIATALTSLANGTEFSAAVSGGVIEWDESDAENGSFNSGSCQLLVSTVDQANAQSLAEAAVTAINSAISAISPAVTVTFETETADGAAEGGFVFDLLQ